MTESQTFTDLHDRARSSRRLVKRLIKDIDSGVVDPEEMIDGLGLLEETLDAVLVAQTQAEISERTAHLYYVSRMIGSSLESDTVLEMVMDAVIDLTEAERGFLVLLEDGELTMKTGRNMDQLSLNHEDMTISETIVWQAINGCESILVENAQQDDRFSGQASVISYNLSSVMVSPLQIDGQALGALYVDSTMIKGLFGPDDLDLMTLFGEQAAIAIHNAMEVERRERELREEIDVLKIEIDEIKRQQQTAAITESEGFQELAARARELREERDREDYT